MRAVLHDIHLEASFRTFLHAATAFLAGLIALVAAAYATGSMETLAQSMSQWIHNVEPDVDASFFPNALLFGLLLDGLIGVAVSLLVFNRLHFHRWLPRKSAAS